MGLKNTLAEVVSTNIKKAHVLSQNKLVSDAIENMRSRSIGALVILGDDENVTGIFSERDLLNRVAAPGLDAGTTKISDVMTPEPVCVDTSTTVEEAIQIVTNKHIRHLPLVSAGKLQGLISSADLSEWVVNAQQIEIDGLRQKLIAQSAKSKATIALVIGFSLLVVISILIN